jgi:membrane-bound lytic murein transglycosylase D
MHENRIAIVLGSIAIIISMIAIVLNWRDRQQLTPQSIEEPLSIEISELPDVPLIESQAYSISLPGKLSFAGEDVPLHLPDIRERLDRELHINTYWHTNTIFLIKRANRWLPMIEEVLEQHGIPNDFKYLAVIESGLENVRSPKGAVGFWQILQPTAKELGLEVSRWVDERYDPLKSTEAACKYLKKAYEKFGDWTLVAASYNRGIKGMERAMDNQQATNYYDLMLNEETARYVFRILACKEILERPARYGFKIDQAHLYRPLKFRYVEVSDDINDLVKFALQHQITYKELKWFNPWLQDDKLKVSRGKTYQIAVSLVTD